MSGKADVARAPTDPLTPRGEKAFMPGRTNYVSENYDTETSFRAEAPPNSKYATALQQICVDVQKKQSPDRKKSQKLQSLEDKSPAIKSFSAVRRSGEVVLTRRTNSNKQVSTQSAQPAPMRFPGQVYRHENADEIAYQSKGDKGRMWVSAPKGSIEAEQYDEIAQARQRPQARTVEVQPESQGTYGWVAKFWRG